MHALAQNWRTAADQFTTAGEFDVGGLPDLWPDTSGQDFAGRLEVVADTAIVTARGMVQLADRAAYFGDEVAGVKTGIRDLIDANLWIFELAGSLPGGIRDWVQQYLVDQVAGLVTGLITDAAGRISASGGPLSAAPPPVEGDTGWGADLQQLGADVVNGLASFGNAALNHPELVLAAATGGGIVLAGLGGTTAGVALTSTGVGAVGGVPLASSSAPVIGTGAVIAGGALAAIAAEAAGDDRVTPLDGAGTEAAAPPKISGPKEFEPEELRGRSPDEIRGRIPEDWGHRPSKSGGGEIFNDPAHRGRQIRIMPGYPPNSRPDPVTWGPYAEVTQNGRTAKVPLEGNPTLEGS